VSLRARRYQVPNQAIEHADCATMLGNDFTHSTFAYAGKPIYRLPLPSAATYPAPAGKPWDECRRRFLWFGSDGMVHKGLDLLLEAFAAMPGYHLTICGPVSGEPDFEHAYRQELYHTPNIETVGWVDVNSERFLNLLNRSVALLYPSCSEGQSGAVVTCMHAGLIPVLSRQSGVDVGDFGMLFPECTIAEIRKMVEHVSSLPAGELEARSRCTWETARRVYTRENYAREYRDAAVKILQSGGKL
jgi:glycosyltransferase involved in cell wall biosynthesis